MSDSADSRERHEEWEQDRAPAAMTPPKKSARECLTYLKQVPREPGRRSGLSYELLTDSIEALERAAEVEADNAKLSANQCLHDIHGDDHGNPYCPRIASLEEQLRDALAEIERLKQRCADSDAVNARYVQRVAMLENEQEGLLSLNTSLTAERDEARSEVAELERDAERLEWLSHSADLRNFLDRLGGWTVITDGGSLGPFRELREAIDAAKAGESQHAAEAAKEEA